MQVHKDNTNIHHQQISADDELLERLVFQADSGLIVVFGRKFGVAAEGFGAEAGDGAVGEGAAEVARGHLVDAVAGEGFYGIGEGEVLDGSGYGIGVVGATQLALVTTDDPVASHCRDPLGQLLVVVLDEQTGEAA